MSATVDRMMPERLRGYRLRRVGPKLWRVSDERGLAIGHIARGCDDRSGRYDARRFSAIAGTFSSLGSFCRIEDALAALHDSR